MWPQITRTVGRRVAPHRQYAPIPRPPETGLSLYPGEPENCRRSLRLFLAIWAHLGLLYLIFIVYRIEGRAFQLLTAIALAALPIHYVLHYRWKKPFFVATSVAGLVWVFGPSVAAIVLPVALILIGVCFLPISWIARATMIGAIALGLALLRGHTAGASFDCAWPILGSMFMFRMILYLYELKHSEKRETVLDTLSYFFLLPNYCFLLFPVVDYRTLQRGYFAGEVHATLRGGLRMIFRGTIHLLLYRLIYHELLIRAEEVHSAASLAGYLVCNYLLYLRVSGQFHIACGMLHLFGFQLPETHRRYLLATGFTDYWRRINIYWKDFMVRVVFNPLVFRLKRWPQAAKLAAATAVVFLATWLLHAYQSFWLRGAWGFSVPDALFWGILGLLVMINVQRDARAPRGRLRKALDLAPRALAVRSLNTAATFATIALLWSLWSSPSLGAWLAMFQRAFAASS
jgi:alginate O-acetyltransferase complex protein AlgI